MLRSFIVFFGLNCMMLADVRSGFIFEQAPFASCHASTITETRPGEFLAAWFGGDAEGKPNVAIWGSRMVDGLWSPPFALVREPNIATYNPVLFYTKDRTLWLYYKFGPHPTAWTGGRLSSKDDGKTWSQPEHLPAGIYGPIKNKPLVLSDGSVVSGTSVESYQAWTAWVERSQDNGKTWTKHGPIVYPGENRAAIQPAVVRLRDGRLRMFVRTTDKIGYIASADSNDGGAHWSELRKTTLPNPNSGIDAVGLQDGRILMIYNHTRMKRSPLNLAISDDGENWSMIRTLEADEGEYSYPAIIQAADGTIHATYTWHRQRIKHVAIPPNLLATKQ